MSWIELARRVGCTDSALCHIFTSGRKAGSISLLSRVARATGLPLQTVVNLRGKGQAKFLTTLTKRQGRNGKVRPAA